MGSGEWGVGRREDEEEGGTCSDITIVAFSIGTTIARVRHVRGLLTR